MLPLLFSFPLILDLIQYKDWKNLLFTANTLKTRVYEPSRLGTNWQKFAILIYAKNTRTCLAKQDQAGAYVGYN